MGSLVSLNVCEATFLMSDGIQLSSFGTAPDPTSDNVTRQETTKQDPSDMGPDGASLPCPGSSVVAEDDDLDATWSLKFW